MTVFISFLMYVVICLFAYLIFSGKFRLTINNSNNIENYNCFSCKNIILISLLFTLYNVYCTKTSLSFGGDRLNYENYFVNNITTSSLGLDFIYKMVRFIGGDFYHVLYITTFISCFITFIALKKLNTNKDIIFILLMLTQFIFNTFTSLKQTYACAFGSLFFVNAFKDKKFKNVLLCIILIVISCLFHYASFILVPIYFLLLIYKKNFALTLICLLLFIVLFAPILNFLMSILKPIFPVLVEKINQYFFLVEEMEVSRISFIKGAPFYYITFILFIHRKKYVDNIKKYDKYFFISFVASISLLMSIYSYWLQRLIHYFYLPVFYIFTLVQSNEKKYKLKMFNYIVVIALLFIVLIRWFILTYINYGGF